MADTAHLVTCDVLEADAAGGWLQRLLFEIVRIPSGADREDVVAAVNRIRPHGHGVFLRTGANPGALGHFATLGVMGVGLDVYHDARPEDAVMSALEDFVEEVSQQGLHTYVVGLRSVSLSVAAVCAGFDFVGSREIAASLEPWGLDDHVVKPLDLFRTTLGNTPVK